MLRSKRYLQTTYLSLQNNAPKSSKSAISSKNVTYFRFPKSKQQLSEEQENPDLKVKPTGYTAQFLGLNPIKKIDRWMDMKLSPDINQRRTEIWFGFWETWDTCMIAGRHWRWRKIGTNQDIKNRIFFWKKPVISDESIRDLTYKEMMQIDRAKREFPKLLREGWVTIKRSKIEFSQ